METRTNRKSRNAERAAFTSRILEEVVTALGSSLPSPPQHLFHYTSLETIEKILRTDNVRLSHAEYSNDRRELKEATDLVVKQLKAKAVFTSGSGTVFYQNVASGFSSQVTDLDVYIFCMCAGNGATPASGDVLSQWRAYAQDGRGGAIVLEKHGLDAIVWHMPGLRINPVIYDMNVQRALIDAVITNGHQHFQSGGTLAVDATIDALIYCVPLMKHEGFREENEWRLIYTPIESKRPPTLGFHPRRDFLAPFVELQDLWTQVRPSISGEYQKWKPIGANAPVGTQLLPATGVIVGPSLHQDLNIRSLEKAVAQYRVGLQVNRSEIPYRSLG